MPIALTSTGLEISTLEEIQGDITDQVHAGISPTLNLTSTSALGQKIGATASQLRQLHEAVQALYSSWDPDQATDESLDRIGKLTGTRRNPATPSTALMTITLASGTYAAGSLVVNVVGSPEARFSNDNEIITAGGTLTGVPFTAEEAGPTAALANTLTVIANPITGFSAPTNPTDATQGKVRETNAAYRRRRALELALKGSTTVDAIRADLLQVDDEAGEPMFDFVQVVENDTDATDGDGRPPHSFEALVVSDATDNTIAKQVLLVKPAGIRAYGTTVTPVADTQGNTHQVGFTRPTPVLIYITVSPMVIEGLYAGDDVMEDAILNYGAQNLTVGLDVIHARILQLVMSVPGVYDATVYIGLAGFGPQTNYTIGPRQVAVLDSTRIDIFTTYSAGAP